MKGTRKKTKLLAQLVSLTLLCGGVWTMDANLTDAATIGDTTDGVKVTPQSGNIYKAWPIQDNILNITAIPTAWRNLSGVLIYGGYTTSRSVGITGNTVNLSGGLWRDFKWDTIIYGGATMGAGSSGSSATVSDNTVNMTGGSVKYLVGGYSVTSNHAVKNNHVNISAGTVNDVYGGWFNMQTFSGKSVVGNTVIITGGNVNGHVYGGYQSGTNGTGVNAVRGNTVTINGNITKGSRIAGGWAEAGLAVIENIVNIVKGTLIDPSIFGGYRGSDGQSNYAPSENQVNISGGTIKGGGIYGGFSNNNGYLENNAVNITGGIFEAYDGTYGRIYGGYNNKNGGTVQNNTVSITNAKGTGFSLGSSTVYGGYGNSGSVTGNSVTVTGSTLNVNVSSNYATLYGGYGQTGEVTKNAVTITNSRMRGSVTGGRSDSSGSATGNSVTISNSTIYGSGTESTDHTIYGGYSGGAATGNTVTITGSLVDPSVRGGYSGNGSATGNTVNITNSTLQGYIYGGYSDNGSATGNTVNITSSTLYCPVYGGYAQYGTETGNTVNLNNAVITSLYGGNKTATGNILNLTGINKVNSTNGFSAVVENFATINFLDTVTWQTESPVLTANTFTNIGGIDISNASHLYEEENTGGMTLITSGNSNLAGITVTYKGGSWKTVAGDSKDMINTNATNEAKSGLTIGYTHKNTLSLTSSGQNLKVTNSTTYNSAKFDLAKIDRYGDDWIEGGYTFSSGANIKAGGLDVNFTDLTTPITNAEPGETFTLLSLDGNSGSIGTASQLTKTISVNGEEFPVYGSMYFDADRQDTLSVTAKKVDYTVGASSQVEKVFFNTDKITYNPGGTYFDAKDNFTFAGSLPFDATNLTFDTYNANPYGTSMTLLKANSLNVGTVTNSDGVTIPVSLTDGNNITFGGTASGTITAANNAVTYKVGDVAASSIKLGSMAWGSAASSLPTGWTVTAGTAVDASEFAFTGATAAITPNTTAAILTGSGLGNSTVSGGANRPTAINYTDSVSNITYDATALGTVAAADNALNYTVNSVGVNSLTLGEMAWGSTADAPTGWQASAATTIDGTNFVFAGMADTAVKAGDSARLLNLSGLTTANAVTEGTEKELSVIYTADNGVVFGATATGEIAATTDALNYTVEKVNVPNASLLNWDKKTSAAVPDGWEPAAATEVINVNTDMNGILPNETTTILTSNDTFDLSSDTVTFTGGHVKDETNDEPDPFIEYDEFANVLIDGQTSGGVEVNNTAKTVIYTAGDKEVANIYVIAPTFTNGATLFDGSNTGYKYEDATLNTDFFDEIVVADDNPLQAESMTLLKGNDSLKNNGDFWEAVEATEEQTGDYEDKEAAPGVTISGQLAGKLAQSAGGTDLVLNVTSDQVSSLTFKDVEWQNSGALIDKATLPSVVSFEGATVDTSNINFTNLHDQGDGEAMTLAANLGEDTTLGTINGETSTSVEGEYKVGSGLKGKGRTEFTGGNLTYTTLTGTGASEESHNTLMGAAASMTALSGGNDFILEAGVGLADKANTGSDGLATFAKVGGGSMSQETGSHVDVSMWNSVIAVGRNIETEKDSREYGVFFEYGQGNYTTHNGNQRGDGSMYYTGGGVLGKWQNNKGFYVDGSLRLGTIHDDAHSVMYDIYGNPSSYKTDSGYWGFHLGVGREIKVNDKDSVDFYGRYFFNRVDGSSFDAANNHYDLDAVTSQILRLGTRYTLKGNKWHFYSGLAYQHEFDGKGTGRVDGNAIRGADTSGGSIFGEIGAKMVPTATNPWSIDFYLNAFGGKKNGVTGGVAIAFMF
ncbi:MAG: hypothetical protein IJ849_08610 [Selenomonadaceae bacterium]|nr:hypothetical protein [Selenomonadaceae bacterium]